MIHSPIVVVQLLSCVQLFATLWTQHTRPPVLHHLLKFAQVHVHCISDAIQPSYPLMPSSASALSLSHWLTLGPQASLLAPLGLSFLIC